MILSVLGQRSRSQGWLLLKKMWKWFLLIILIYYNYLSQSLNISHDMTPVGFGFTRSKVIIMVTLLNNGFCLLSWELFITELLCCTFCLFWWCPLIKKPCPRGHIIHKWHHFYNFHIWSNLTERKLFQQRWNGYAWLDNLDTSHETKVLILC